jgi:hypothetical protein
VDIRERPTPVASRVRFASALRTGVHSSSCCFERIEVIGAVPASRRHAKRTLGLDEAEDLMRFCWRGHAGCGHGGWSAAAKASVKIVLVHV